MSITLLFMECLSILICHINMKRILLLSLLLFLFLCSTAHAQYNLYDHYWDEFLEAGKDTYYDDLHAQDSDWERWRDEGFDSTSTRTNSNEYSWLTKRWVSSSGSCLIKGNISYKTGEKIYHIPGWKDYDDTKINTSYGERWFCTEWEAYQAGWRAPYYAGRPSYYPTPSGGW